MLELFTGYSLWEYVTVFFDNVVKIIYLIYTAVASCLDLLQCLMRKLAGLDTYWVNGKAYTQQDPILEFIYGMLGFGDNASAYSALSTVFWSLAIFAIIVLVLATMIAIIKSHYNEDSNKTNPLTYIYTAIKAVFTFAIVPVAVILGIYISQFLLQTMDNITAGKATEETLKGIYGSADNFIAQGEMNGQRVYTRYDFFGFGPQSTSQTISGQLFRVAAYDANRIRYGGYDVDKLIANKKSANEAFGDLTYKPEGTSKADWVAQQIDYAFMNNLQFKNIIWAEELYVAASDNGTARFGDVLVTITSADFFAFVGASEGFSKYNVGLVWYYYNLWKFNFFVGFASIMITLGLLVNIIIGLMSRLIFGAALFLIYPPTLGLAPLDEWKAFKEWRKKFVAQILMAFGSIISMNIFFLLLPYLNEISWFNFALADYIVNTLVIIVGLLTVKTFISFVSGLIGADDANATGEGMKKELGQTLAKTGGLALGAANIAMKFGNPLLGAGVKAARGGIAQAWSKHLDKKATREEGQITSETERADRMERANNAMEGVRNSYEHGHGAKQAEYDAAMKMAEQRARAQGINIHAPPGSKDAEAWEQMQREAQDEFLTKNNSSYKSAKELVENNGMNEHDLDHQRDAQEFRTRRQASIANNYLNPETGRMDFQTWRQFGKKWMGDITGALLKGAKEGLPDLGVNVKTISGVFGRLDNNKRNDKGEVVGTYGYTQSNETWRNPRSRQTALGTLQTLGRGIAAATSTSGGPPPQKPDDSDRRIERASDRIDKAAEALLKATENLRRFRP